MPTGLNRGRTTPMTFRRPTTLVLLTALAAAGVLTATALAPPAGRVEAGGQAAEPTQRPAAAAPDRRTDEQALRKAAGDYVEAINGGDPGAVLAFWAPDADYIDEAGKMTRGREAIAALFTKSLPALKGTKATGRVQSLKFLRPEIALEDGTLEFVAPDGSRDSSRYAVVWTKAGDKWLISSARDLPAEVNDLPSLAAAQLQPLEWLVGEWQDRSDAVDVHLACHWAPNKSFLLMDYTVRRAGAEPLQVRQRVGWDPLNGVVRSWTFDSTGGFGEAVWQWDAKRWVTNAEGVLPDGGTGTATHVWEFVDANTFVWRSADRVVDGQPVADAEVKFVRKAAQ
jgi:uncharacterized protein (TIGR02246 family)